MKTINNNILLLNSNDIGDRRKKPNYNNISFRAVSINPNELPKSQTGKIIQEGLKKLKNIFARDNTNEINKFDDKFDDITKEMFIRREIARELPWWRSYNKALRKIDKMELNRKSYILNNKESLIKEKVEQVKTMETVVEETATEINRADKNGDLVRRRHNKDLNAYKGNLSHNKGFSKIAGYDEEKNILTKYFISEIRNEQKGEPSKVPGSVLFFGPTGNGKTTFAKAFANETGCDLVPVRIAGDSSSRKQAEIKFFQTLLKKAEKSEEKFQKTGARSILFVDEITKVTDKGSSILPQLTDFLDNCSSKYHCTLFATSNHPLNIALPMEGEKAVFPYVVSLDPPNLKNKSEIMKHYLRDRMNPETDYNKFAELIDTKERKTEKMFNIAQLKDDICLEGTDKKINEQDIINNIDKIQPNIDKDALNKYSHEMDTLLKHEVEE